VACVFRKPRSGAVHAPDVGLSLFAFGIVVWLRGRKSPHLATRRAFDAVMAMLVAQIVLGIGRC
jgi:hypothetical protein